MLATVIDVGALHEEAIYDGLAEIRGELALASRQAEEAEPFSNAPQLLHHTVGLLHASFLQEVFAAKIRLIFSFPILGKDTQQGQVITEPRREGLVSLICLLLRVARPLKRRWHGQ